MSQLLCPLESTPAVTPRAAERRRDFLRNHLKRHRQKSSRLRSSLDCRLRLAELRRLQHLRKIRAQCHYRVTKARSNAARHRLRLYQKENRIRTRSDSKQAVAEERRQAVTIAKLTQVRDHLAKVEDASLGLVQPVLSVQPPVPKAQTRRQRKLFNQLKEDEGPVSLAFVVHEGRETQKWKNFILDSKKRAPKRPILTRALIEHRLESARGRRERLLLHSLRRLACRSSCRELTSRRAQYLTITKRESLRFFIKYRQRAAAARRHAIRTILTAKLRAHLLQVEIFKNRVHARRRRQKEAAIPSPKPAAPRTAAWALSWSPGISAWSQMVPGRTAYLDAYFSRYETFNCDKEPHHVRAMLAAHRRFNFLSKRIQFAEEVSYRVLRASVVRQITKARQLDHYLSKLSNARRRKEAFLSLRRRRVAAKWARIVAIKKDRDLRAKKRKNDKHETGKIDVQALLREVLAGRV